MMENWVLINKQGDFQNISKELDIDMVVAKLLVNRDYNTKELMYSFLHPSAEDLKDENLLQGMDAAVTLLQRAIEAGTKIRIIGDYDVDGIMSTYILHQALLKVGADADYAIPHRIEDGYGVNPDMVKAAHEEGVGLIITCDNGIAAFDAVNNAKELGMTFIITDHHEIPYDEMEGKRFYRTPSADAIVNPKQAFCSYPFKSVCGAVVAWKLVFALYNRFSIARSEAMSFIEYAAIATVCDVMELRDENRFIVVEGLKALKNTKNIGLQSLLQEAGLDGVDLTAYHMGFVLGPCLNATGRLDSAATAIELLEADSYEKAKSLAIKLKELNDTRKAMTLVGIEQAMSVIDEENLLDDKVLVVYVKELHESLAGIVAGRIKETYYRPTIVLTDCEDGIKGSGRSIEAFNMFESISACKEYLIKFGGHPMAAGLSFSDMTAVDAFRRKINENCELTEGDFIPKVKIDLAFPLAYLNFDLIEGLSALEPFGNGNSKPLFGARNALIVGAKYIGKDKNFLKLSVRNEMGRRIDALFFGDAKAFEEYVCEKYSKEAFKELLNDKSDGVKMDLAFYPQINEFRGEKSIQIVVEHYL